MVLRFGKLPPLPCGVISRFSGLFLESAESVCGDEDFVVAIDLASFFSVRTFFSSSSASSNVCPSVTGVAEPFSSSVPTDLALEIRSLSVCSAVMLSSASCILLGAGVVATAAAAPVAVEAFFVVDLPNPLGLGLPSCDVIVSFDLARWASAAAAAAAAFTFASSSARLASASAAIAASSSACCFARFLVAVSAAAVFCLCFLFGLLFRLLFGSGFFCCVRFFVSPLLCLLFGSCLNC